MTTRQVKPVDWRGAAVNNGIKDPLQGYDVDVWLTDQATGKQLLIGRFTSIQITIRNATEPYMEFNQRVPRLLDGEFQIGWVLERGMIDSRAMIESFGLSRIVREDRLNRSPRFMLAFEMDAPELHEDTNANLSPLIRSMNGEVNGIDDRNWVTDSNQGNAVLNQGELMLADGTPGEAPRALKYRSSKGQYRLTYCKLDSFTIGAMAGRSVIANRWEGLAEGITYIHSNNAWSGTSFQVAASTNTLRGGEARVGAGANGTYASLFSYTKDGVPAGKPVWTLDENAQGNGLFVADYGQGAEGQVAREQSGVVLGTAI